MPLNLSRLLRPRNPDDRAKAARTREVGPAIELCRALLNGTRRGVGRPRRRRSARRVSATRATSRSSGSSTGWSRHSRSTPTPCGRRPPPIAWTHRRPTCSRCRTRSSHRVRSCSAAATWRPGGTAVARRHAQASAAHPRCNHPRRAEIDADLHAPVPIVVQSRLPDAARASTGRRRRSSSSG